MGNFDKALWYPEVAELLSEHRAKVSGYDVTHQALHTLVSHRFGSEMRERPRVTMLSEAIAGGAQLYYELMYLRAGGSIGGAAALGTYKESARILRKPILRMINAMLEDPFGAYKKNVLESFAIQRGVFASLVRATQGRPAEPGRLAARLRGLEHLPFLRHKDFGNFALFEYCYCGPSSSKRDRLDTRRCLRLLERAGSMLELMEQLGLEECTGPEREEREPRARQVTSARRGGDPGCTRRR
jgi:hypothetical protein